MRREVGPDNKERKSPATKENHERTAEGRKEFMGLFIITRSIKYSIRKPIVILGAR